MKGDFSRSTFNRSKHYSAVLMQQGRVQVDADWNEQHRIHQHHAQTAAKDVIGFSGAPLFDAGFQIAVVENRLNIGHGRYYVDGVLCENESNVLYGAQPDFPNAPDIVNLLNGAQTTVGIVYLDVWRRHITAIDDPTIREAALGGPDTTTRTKTIWQVKVLPVRPPATGNLACGDQRPEWDELVKPRTGALSARSQPLQNGSTPCLIPPMAGYRRLENQLYRVEIHKGGTLGAATAPTFKWSRDNGSVVTAIDRVNGREVTVHDLGRDQTLGFSIGQWVEIIDDGQELTGQAGQLIQIDAVDPGTRVITLKTAPQAVDLARRPKLRRWDSAGELTVASPPASGGWVALEDGVEVKFEAGTYGTSDYWLIPARTATGNVDWPFAVPQTAFGIAHRYTRLAIATLSGAALSVQDCRRLFAPLTAGIPAVHITGINWINDDVLPQGFQQLVNTGLQIFFDGPLQPLPATSAAAVVVVTMDVPIGPGDSLPTKALGPVVLRGEVAFPSPNVLQWKPAQSGSELTDLLTVLTNAQITQALLRINLKGTAIWSEQAGIRFYLDGAVLGQPGFRTDNVTQRIELRLPSGRNTGASDFDSWFYLQVTVPDANLRSITLEASSVLVGGRVNALVELDRTVAANVDINLTSSATAVATVPQTVRVLAGQSRASFVVTALSPPSSTDVVITATFRNIQRQESLRVQVVSVTVSPASITLVTGQIQTFTASVAGAANTAVTWSVQEANGGSINSNGQYISPEGVGTFRIVATSVADPSKKGTATVTIRRKVGDKSPFEKSHDTPPKTELDRLIDVKIRDNVKVREGKIREVIDPPRPLDGLVTPNFDLPVGRSFIGSDERPDLEERHLLDTGEPPLDPTPEIEPPAGRTFIGSAERSDAEARSLLDAGEPASPDPTPEIEPPAGRIAAHADERPDAEAQDLRDAGEPPPKDNESTPQDSDGPPERDPDPSKRPRRRRRGSRDRS